MNSGQANLYMRGGGLKKVARYHCLPNVAGCVIVDEVLQAIILEHAPPLAVQFYPVTVRDKNNETDRYSFVIPRIHVPCIDMANAVVSRWLIPGKQIGGFRHITHLPGCLKQHAIARDSIFRPHIVISNALKDALEATGDKGLFFIQPEEDFSF